MRGTSLLLFKVAGLIGVASATSCNANNCLRAVRATSRLPQASVDCSSFLRSTFTPATVTYTDYSTVSEIASETLLVTYTDTKYETLTVVAKETATIEQPGTTTTVTSYDAALKKRQLASTIPPYASPCTGTVQYTSACSCIGITGPVVVTAPTPSTTVTLPTTVTYSTQTIVTTVETTSITVTDATTTVTTTDSTKTLPGPSATVTATVPYPADCKSPALFNGLRPENNAELIRTDRGNIPYPECCLQCWLFPDCIAYVRFQNTCLLLSTGDSTTLVTPQCPNGQKRTVFGGAGGIVGKGPCQITV